MSKTEQSAEGILETRMMKALSHPLRWRILESLTSGPASPSMIAAQLGEPLGNVSYHVKILLSCDAIELVETRPVRGALEHIYRAPGRDNEKAHFTWTGLELDQKAYDELAVRLDEVLTRALELNAETARRVAKGADRERPQTHKTELTILHLHRAPVRSK